MWLSARSVHLAKLSHSTERRTCNSGRLECCPATSGSFPHGTARPAFMSNVGFVMHVLRKVTDPAFRLFEVPRLSVVQEASKRLLGRIWIAVDGSFSFDGNGNECLSLWSSHRCATACCLQINLVFFFFFFKHQCLEPWTKTPPNGVLHVSV